jgi:hypothetical protein
VHEGLLREELALALLSVLRPDFTRLRIPEGRDKRHLLRAIDRGRRVPNLTRMLRAIGSSPSRLGAWRRAAQGCELDDAESCPAFSPHALAQPSAGLDLAAEPCSRPLEVQVLRADQFQRHVAAQALLVREVDDAHAAATESA